MGSSGGGRGMDALLDGGLLKLGGWAGASDGGQDRSSKSGQALSGAQTLIYKSQS